MASLTAPAMSIARPCAGERAEAGAEHAQGERAAEHEPAQLAARRARGAQQPDLAGPLADGHRQRVDDQERADEQDDRGDEGGGALERRRRGAEGASEIAGDASTYGSVMRWARWSATALDAPGARRRSTRVAPGMPKVGAGDVDRDDDRAAGARRAARGPAGCRRSAGRTSPLAPRRISGPPSP